MCTQHGTVQDKDAVSHVRPVSLRDWTDMLGSIFLAHDVRHYSNDELLLRLHEEVCRCSESLRKERFEEIVARLPIIFERFVSCTNRLGIDLAAAVWHKYPGVCPDCFVELNCQCITLDISYHATHVRLQEQRLRLESRPSSISQFQEMHARIYGRINTKLKQRAQVIQHLIEEVGEFSEAARVSTRAELEAEAADLFMWLLAVANRLGVSLEDLLWVKYPGVCGACRQRACECKKT